MTVPLEVLEPAPLDPRATQTMVPMRDGVELATDTYLPGDGAPVATVLVRLPYDKCGRYTFMPDIATRFVAEGYAFVVQDVRGKFRSGGETLAFVHEVDDGYDTLEWIIAQSWSNGVVGMWGDSYYGFTQWAAVASGHPALKAIVPRVTSANLGAWLQGGVDPLYGGQYLAEVWIDGLMRTWPIDWSRRPLSEVFDPGFEAAGVRSAAFDAFLAHSRGDEKFDPFARAGHPFERLAVPTLHGVGWFDNILPDSMRDYERLVADPKLAALQYLVADATDHENYQLSDVPITDDLNHDQNEAALARMLPRYLDPAVEFFEVFLKGTRPAESLPRARWRHGREGWREAGSWPPADARELRLYLTDGGLGGSAPEQRQAVEWVHDPSDLVPSTVVNPFAFLYECPDESSVAERSDVLTFTGPVLEQPLDLTGRVTAHLEVGSDAASMHVFVKLVEVMPDGTGLMLLRGQVTVRPGDDPTAEVFLAHTGHRVDAGHRLRVQIASSDFPLYVAHPGTDENPWFARQSRVATQRLFTGGRDASHIRLTVL